MKNVIKLSQINARYSHIIKNLINEDFIIIKTLQHGIDLQRGNELVEVRLYNDTVHLDDRHTWTEVTIIKIKGQYNEFEEVFYKLPYETQDKHYTKDVEHYKAINKKCIRRLINKSRGSKEITKIPMSIINTFKTRRGMSGLSKNNIAIYRNDNYYTIINRKNGNFIYVDIKGDK